jgi:hypothetical protein
LPEEVELETEHESNQAQAKTYFAPWDGAFDLAHFLLFSEFLFSRGRQVWGMLTFVPLVQSLLYIGPLPEVCFKLSP